VKAYRSSIAVFSALFIVLGLVFLVETARLGGGVGYVFGALFVALGTARLWLLRKKRS